MFIFKILAKLISALSTGIEFVLEDMIVAFLPGGEAYANADKYFNLYITWSIILLGAAVACTLHIIKRRQLYAGRLKRKMRRLKFKARRNLIVILTKIDKKQDQSKQEKEVIAQYRKLINEGHNVSPDDICIGYIHE